MERPYPGLLSCSKTDSLPGDVAGCQGGWRGMFWKVIKASKATSTSSNGCFSGSKVPGCGSPQGPTGTPELLLVPTKLSGSLNSGPGSLLPQVRWHLEQEELLWSSFLSLPSVSPRPCPHAHVNAQHYSGLPAHPGTHPTRGLLSGSDGLTRGEGRQGCQAKGPRQGSPGGGAGEGP